MDLSTLFGIILGTVALGLSVMISQGSPSNVFVDATSLMVVFGGTFAAVMICFPGRNLGGFFHAFRQVFVNRPPQFAKLVREIVSLAEIARSIQVVSPVTVFSIVVWPLVRSKVCSKNECGM